MTKRGTSKAAKAERRMRFVEVFMTNGENATQAYKAAGFTAGNDHVAGTEGHKLLKDPEVKALIEARRAKIRERFTLSADLTFQEIRRLANFNPSQLLDAQGKLLPLHKLDEDALAGLHLEMRPGKRGGAMVIERIRMVRPSEKNSAIEKAAKVLKLYETPPAPPAMMDELSRLERARRVAFLLISQARKSAAKVA